MSSEGDESESKPGQYRSRGTNAGFAFQDRGNYDPNDLTHDWEWYSEGDAARLTFGGPNGAEKLKFDEPKGSLTISCNVGIGTTPSAKLHVNGDLVVEKGATIKDRLNANKGLTVKGGGLTVLNGNSLNAQGGATVDGDLILKDSSLKVGANIELKDEDKLRIMTFGVNNGESGHDYQILYKAKGHFEKKTLAMHIHKDNAFGIYSSGLESLLEVEGGSGNVYIKGNLFVNGSIGIICMWSGDVKGIPKGWKLCDGKDVGKIKVPDLRSRFIVGAGDGPGFDEANAYGDASDIEIVEGGDHTHEIAQFDHNVCSSDACRTALPICKTKGNVSHTHDTKITNKDGATKELKPKWYALCFIIYIGK